MTDEGLRRAERSPVSLRSLLWPSSIAIIGASADSESLSGRPLELLLQHGYKGPIYPVNPRHREIRGLRAYPAVADIGEPVDLALIAVRASQVVGLLQECAAAGVRNAVVLSSGFAEEGESGSRLESAMRGIADASGMRVCGPNGEGFLNVLGGVPVTFSPAADYERGLSRLVPGPLAVVSQSGGLGFSLFNWGQETGPGFSYVVTTGNEADLDSLEFVDFLVDDPDTRVVMMLIEGLRRPALLGSVASKARAAGKFLVVSKLGRSRSGSRAAASHTAHLAGSDAAYRAAFERYGVLTADDQEELLDVGLALAAGKTMAGSRVAVLTLSGGAGVWVADLCEAEGLEVPELPPEVQAALRTQMPSYGSARNPIDVTAQVWQTGGVAAALEILLSASFVDGVVLVVPMASAGRLRGEGELGRILAASPVPVVLYSYTRPSADGVALLNELRLPFYTSPRRVARVMRALAEAGRGVLSDADRGGPSGPGGGGPALRATASWPGRLVEQPAKELLRSWGVPVPAGRLVGDQGDAVRAADAIGYPVALKVQSPDLPHKSDIGGVMLSLRSAAEVESAYPELLRRVSAAAPEARLAGVLVEAMARPGHAMIVGAINDADFGPLVMLGTGGIHAEILNDTAFALAPLSPEAARVLVAKVRGSALLAGLRGEPAADRDALVRLLVTVSELMLAYRDDVADLDLNPVLVHPEGEGISVVDAWITGLAH